MSGQSQTVPSAWVRRFARLIRPGGRVLDLAAGSGRHTRLLRELGHAVVLPAILGWHIDQDSPRFLPFLVVLKLAVPGMISGALSWALIDSADRWDLNFQFEGFGLLLLPVSIYPGLVFGLILGAVLHVWAKVSLLRAIGYAQESFHADDGPGKGKYARAVSRMSARRSFPGAEISGLRGATPPPAGPSR